MTKEEKPKTAFVGEKNYEYIVRLKRGGDYSTIFAINVNGTLADPYITITRKNKDGEEKTAQISSEAVESIEQA